MKIAVISSSVFAVGQGGVNGLSGYGGLEQIAWQLAKGLGEKGHEVYLFAPEGSACPAVTVIPIGPPGQWGEDKSYNSYWKYLLHFNDGGVIVDHSWSKFSYILKMEGRLTAPILGVCHAPINTQMSAIPPVEKPCFVCISQDQAKHFEGLFSKHARVAHNGIDLDLYKPLHIPRTDRFLFLARFSSIKGPDIAQEACKAVGVGLDLIGDSSITHEPDYLAACKRAADDKQIKLVGPCLRGEAAWWYSQAHAFLHPNQRFREPLGLAPLEAQACGLPVICFDNGAMRETVVHGQTGYLVNTVPEFVKRVKEVKEMPPTTMNRMRLAAREHAGNFTIDKMVEKYEELCDEAVSTGGW